MSNREAAGEQAEWRPERPSEDILATVLKELLKSLVEHREITCLPTLGNSDITWFRNLIF